MVFETEKLDKSQLVDKVCPLAGKLFNAFTQMGLLVLLRNWVFTRDCFEKHRGFETEAAAAHATLISISLSIFVLTDCVWEIKLVFRIEEV